MKHYLTCLLLIYFFFTFNMNGQDTTDGIVWYPPIQLSDSGFNAFIPTIALSGNDTVHVTYYGGGKRLAYARSVTGGIDFEPVRELLTDSLVTSSIAMNMKIVADGNDVFLFFVNPDPPYPYHSKVRLSHSSDRGETFERIRQISQDRAGEITWATIWKNDIAIIHDITGPRKITRSSDRGRTWTRTNEDLGDFTRIALTQGTLHQVDHKWIDPTNEISYLQSTNLGTTWGKDTILSKIDEWYSDIPSIAGYTNDCSTELLIAWRDTKYGWKGALGASIISRGGLANGKRWLPEVLLTQEPRGFDPRVAINKNLRAVQMKYEVAALDTFHSVVTASNNSLSRYVPVKDLTPQAKFTSRGDVKVSSHAVHVVYSKEVGSTFRVFYQRGEFLQNEATISFSQSLMKFDTTEVSTTVTQSVTVRNAGQDILQIGTATTDNESFQVTPSSAAILPEDSVEFSISFTPEKEEQYTGRIIFYYNSPNSPSCFPVTGYGKWRQDQTQYSRGWNLVSIPVRPGPVQKVPSMFLYDGGYYDSDTLVFGKGYWGKPPDTMTFQGSEVLEDSFIVKKGWNIIGSLSAPIQSATLLTSPMNIVVSPFYGYNEEGYYPADAILPGKGYWVKVNSNGKLILQAQSMSKVMNSK
ncbi:MAG: DUF1573 domain-containing protein [Ignavibacteriae bacterium]|nr:DUF1573 domain-containing protein [Ignavibacteriota bacterium]